MMRVLDLFSGIGTATRAALTVGWNVIGHSEVDRFACRVLEHRFKAIPNLGDVRRLHDWPKDLAPDLIVGGFPCQDFSTAGPREGLDGERGGLAQWYVEAVRRFAPRWFVAENVPGLLSSNGGGDFGAILGELADGGYGVAWRVLDTRFVRVAGYCAGVPQRRRRLFIVGHSGGSWQRAAAVLFDAQGGGWDIEARHEGRRSAAERLGRGPSLFGQSERRYANTLTARMHKGANTTLDEGQTLIVVNARQAPHHHGHVAGTLDTDGHTWAIKDGKVVRNLTPTECERLQGLPDGWTAIEGASDTARYRALGNAISMNVLLWIFARINAIEHYAPLAKGGA